MTSPTVADHPGAAALVESVTPDVVAHIQSLGDPVARATAAQNALEVLVALGGEVGRQRQVAFSTLKARGMSYGQIGGLFGISTKLAEQITTGENS